MAFPHVRVLKPHSLSANSERRGFKRALLLFHEASRRVPAYADFLKKHSVNPGKIESYADFSHVPLTDKNYFSDYTLKELCWDGVLDSSLYVSTSSGSTGIPYFWPRGGAQDTASGMLFKHIYENIFNTKIGTTLVINSFALGTWIAGFEFFNATKFTAEHGNRLVISTPGIDKKEAVNQFKKLAPLFDRIIFAGYPPFIKDIIDEGRDAGIDWTDYDINFLTGGEAVSDIWRNKILETVGKKDLDSFVNVYGMAETGIVAHDTPLSLTLRQKIGAIIKVDETAGQGVVGLYQYYPELRYFESLPDSSLVLTSNAGLPIIRYDTRDTGGLLDRKKMAAYLDANDKWQLPFVYLFGRKDLSISLYALNIYVENIKCALEHSSVTNLFSGLFIMGVNHTDGLDQRFDITVELARDVQINEREIISKLTAEVISTLVSVNSEYAKLLASVGNRAHPHITLVPFGKIETIPGRKHKWVKK